MVLLVEDNEINREVAGEMIAELGFTCVFAGNGREAVEAVQRGGADLVLMDCQMPIMDGYEATGIIREWERMEAETSGPRRVPIIALTAHAMKGDRDICLQYGMDDFLTKPLDPAALTRTLAKWMDARARTPDAVATSADGGTPAAPAASADGEAAAFTPASWMTSGAAAASAPPPISPHSTFANPIDFPSLVERCMGKTALAERLVGKFIQLVPPYTEEIANAVAARDPAAVKFTAHRLKGAAATVSARAISQIAAELEALGRDGRLEPAPEVMRQLQQHVERLLQAHGDDGRRAA